MEFWSLEAFSWVLFASSGWCFHLQIGIAKVRPCLSALLADVIFIFFLYYGKIFKEGVHFFFFIKRSNRTVMLMMTKNAFYNAYKDFISEWMHLHLNCGIGLIRY